MLIYISFYFYSIYINVPFSTYHFQAVNTRFKKKKKSTNCIYFVFPFCISENVRVLDRHNFIDTFLV